MSPTEILIAVLGSLLSFAGAYLVYKRGSRADAASHEDLATAQVYAGYGGLLGRIQEDNADLRHRLDRVEVLLEECISARGTSAKRVRDLEDIVGSLERQIAAK